MIKSLTIYKILISLFIIGCLYLIQLSSQSVFWNNYTSFLWIIFMLVCVGLYLFNKYQKNNNSNKEDDKA